MKFMFEWCVEDLVWSVNKASYEKYGYPIKTSLLPISQELKDEMIRLGQLHNDALNWDDPGSGLIWSKEQISEFLKEAKKAYDRLCKELGPDYKVKLMLEM